MEYGEHIALVYVPAIVIAALVCIFCITLMSIGCHRVMREIIKVSVGASFLMDKDEHISFRQRPFSMSLHRQHIDNLVEEDHNEEDDHHQHANFRTHKYNIMLKFTAMSYLAMVAVVFWIVLIEDVNIGECDSQADCFVTPRALSEQFKFLIPQRVNCSTFEHDNKSILICYKVGFYLLEAFSATGGMLYILTSSSGIILSLATGGGKKRRIITILFLFIFSIAMFVVYFTLLITLPSSSLNLILGVHVLPLLVLIGGPFLMTLLILLYP